MPYPFLLILLITLLLTGFCSPANGREVGRNATISAQPRASGLFGSHEIKSTQLGRFKKWTAMLDRTAKEEQNGDSPYKRTSNSTFRDWPSLLNNLKRKTGPEQIAAVNHYMNRAAYITDIINWGVPDYWASLRQFFSKDGDCEDYAIAKYMALKKLGFTPDDMRIVVVQDTNLDIPHAVLVVTYDGDRLILDNQIAYVVKEKAVLHYRPYYSINEQTWWLHQTQGKKF